MEEYYQDRLSSAPMSAWIVIGSIILASIIILLAACFSAHAQEWSDEEIVNAIYKAEGGSRAKFPYGIRSVNCENESACRKICKNTVKKNRVRFADYGHREYPDFIDFLQSRYCPTAGRNLSKAERKLNGNWKKNVMFFLKKGGTKWNMN